MSAYFAFELSLSKLEKSTTDPFIWGKSSMSFNLIYKNNISLADINLISFYSPAATTLSDLVLQLSIFCWNILPGYFVS